MTAIPEGFSLYQTLEGHTNAINGLHWSPDGRVLVSSSFDDSLLCWETATGNLLQCLPCPSGYPRIACWSQQGQYLAAGGNDKSIHIWDQQGTLCHSLKQHAGSINALAWSPDDSLLASGADDGTVLLWDTNTWQVRHSLNAHARNVNSVAWSPDGNMLASGSDDKLIRLWHPDTGQLLRTLKAHSGMVFSVLFSPTQPLLFSASSDKTIRVWEIITGRQARVLEGHTDVVYKLACSRDGQLFASKSDDDSVRLWRAEDCSLLAVLQEPTDHQLWLGGLAFHPTEPMLASLGKKDREIRLWKLDTARLLALPRASSESSFSGLFSRLRALGTSFSKPTTPIPTLATTVHYTTAKIVLVGDSGVGKTGLGWRLAHNEFKEHASTHGQQFWIIPDLKVTRSDGTECEAVLWDLAGQPDYRLVHALFLDEVDLAIVLFDPSHQQEPLKGVEYWLKQLGSANKENHCRTLLVGARCDRGAPTLTAEELDAFCQQHEVSEGYLISSAMTGEGLHALKTRVRQALRWDTMTATVTTLTFKRIKEFVLGLKDQPRRKNTLLNLEELQQSLQKREESWQFSQAELLTALQHLANHGYITLLRGSAGKYSILLTPDLLSNLASSLILEARRNEKGLGALEESRVLRGEYDLPELSELNPTEKEVLLDAALALFLEHTICFRESYNGESLLVFPSLINQKRPAVDKIPIFEDMSYAVTGAIENLYAALVVLLGYTNTFLRVQQWHNQAQYELGAGEICGFRKIEEREGELEFVLYYSYKVQESTKLLFQGLFERFLRGREVIIQRYPPVICSICNYHQERSEIAKRLKAQKAFMFCGECGGKIAFLSQREEQHLSAVTRETLEREQVSALERTVYAKALVWVKSYLRGRGQGKVPLVFISYAWGVETQERWVKKLAMDMQDAGIEVILDDWDNSTLGSSVSRFISRIEHCDFIVVVGVPLYLDKYENKISNLGSVVAAEVDLIAQRLLATEAEKNTVIPLLLEGEARTALPPLLRGRSYGDFRELGLYFPRLFDLILTLYRIEFRDPAVQELRDMLRKEVQLRSKPV